MRRLALFLTPPLLIAGAVLFWGMRDRETPTVEVPVPMGETVQRVLTDDELRALVHGLDPTRYGRTVRLLALTGCR